ncbi:MAG: hypothetical protein M1831_003208 [Alyxoria varia]|nr:MAG: hypothetical protein M1831_003208 [Alyxoria varia]
MAYTERGTWLERLSAQSTPAPSPPPSHARTHSPLPRRSFQATRPGLPSRTTSLTSLATSSSGNLGNTTRSSNTSGLKNQINASPPAEVEDPLAVLGRLIGADASNHDRADITEYVTRPLHDDAPGAVEGVDFGSLTLEEFVERNSDTSTPHSNNAPSHSDRSIEEYEKDRDKFEELHRTILNCDDVLESVETYLTGFHKDLGTVSREIESLQTRSTNLNGKLENRQMVEKLLGPVVEQLSLSPNVVRKISEGAVDDAWVKALEDLQLRAKAIDESLTNGDAKRIKAIEDMKPLVSDLSDKAVERIREYFAARIKSLRSPNINARIIQQQDFLKRKNLFAFLAKRQPALAEDITQAYTNTLRWYYSTHFMRYRDALSKLKLHTTERSEVIGEDPSSSAARSTAASKDTTKMPGHDPFNVGRRSEILQRPNGSALPASAAEDSKLPVQLETPFLSFNLALIDNASWEYTFLSSFLPQQFSVHAKLAPQFTTIFSPSFEIGHNLTKTLTSESYDTLGILLLVRLTQHFAFVLQRRRVPTLDSYINGTSLLLWPRFQLVIDAHCESLKRLASLQPNKLVGTGGSSAASAAFASLSGTSSSTQASHAGTAPHPVTQRFANLLRGVLSLSSDTGDDEPVSTSVNRLSNEYENLLNRMGQAFGSGEKGRVGRETFLGNNYSLVSAVLDGNDVRGKLAEDTKHHFDLLRRKTSGSK